MSKASEEVPATPRGKESLSELAARLKSKEGREVSGASSRQLKGDMLDATPLEKKDPDNHYRYVGARDPANVKLRQRQGYVPVPEEEAKAEGVDARHGAEDILMRMPREEYDRQVKAVEKETSDRLRAHKADVSGTVEAIARELRDKHGINISADRLMVDE